MANVLRMSRREFLAVTGVAGAGLMLGVAVPLRQLDAATDAAGEAFAEFFRSGAKRLVRQGGNLGLQGVDLRYFLE